MKTISDCLMDGVALSLNGELQYCDPFQEDSETYQAVKKDFDALLASLGLDASHSGTPQWNPFSDFIAPDDRVLIKTMHDVICQI